MTALSVTYSEAAHSARNVTLTLFTALRISWLEAPIEWAALVADSARDAFLAFAQLSTGQAATPTKCRQNTSRVAVAAFTEWVVVETLLAAVAFVSIKIRLAEAYAVIATGDTDSTIGVTLARVAFGIRKISRCALVTLKSSETSQAGAFSRGITDFTKGALRVTFTRNAVGEAIVSWCTLVATCASVFRLAQALASLVVANIIQSARRVTGTQFARWVVVKAHLALQALTTSIAVAALALPCAVVTGSAQGSRRVTVAGFAVWKTIVAGSTAIAVLSLIVRAAWTLASVHLTDTTLSAFCVTVTRAAGWVAIVAHIALVTVWWQKFWPTLTLARPF